MKPFYHRALIVMASFVFGLAVTQAVQGDEEPPLPTWDLLPQVNDKENAGKTFSNLLPEGFDQEPASEFYLGLPGGLKSPPLLLEDSEFSSNDLNLFLHGGLMGVPTPVSAASKAPTAQLALRELPAGLLEGLQTVPLNEYLWDPQTLVTEIPALDVARLLEFHASEARILLYVLVVDHDQKVSDLQPFTELMGRLKSDSQHEVCLAIYPMGEPWRTRFLVTQTVSDHVSIKGLTEMAEDCITDAARAQEPDSQFQRFAVRLSTRLFWLEKALPAVTMSAAGVASISGKTGIHEVGKPVETDAVHAGDPPAAVAPAWRGIPLSLLNWVPFTAMGCGLLGGVLAALIWYGFRRLRKKPQRRVVWMLPELDVPPRLGGAFSGGAGASIQYPSS